MVRTLALILLLAPALWAGKKAHPKPPKPDEGVRWTPTWNGAIEEARALNLPIIVHRHGFY